MGKKGKKSTSFRIDEVVLRLLTEKAERISKQTNRSYSMATIVDTALSETCQEPDDVTLSKIAKHQFGIDVVKPPLNMQDYVSRISKGLYRDNYMSLKREWVTFAKSIPINGTRATSLPHSIGMSIKQILDDPDAFEVMLNKCLRRYGGNEYFDLLFSFIELSRGDENSKDVLHGIHIYYLMMQLACTDEGIEVLRNIAKEDKGMGSEVSDDTISQIIESSQILMQDWKNAS